MSQLAPSITGAMGVPVFPRVLRNTSSPCPPGSRFPLLPGVRSRLVSTTRLVQHLYESGSPADETVILVHANASSGRFYEDLMRDLSEYHVIAPDLRGFGASEAGVVNATRGMRDFSDDLHALVEALGIERFHLVGWSMGGNVGIQYAIDHSDRLHSLTLLAPGSPFGYGGTYDADGRPNHPDFAGSGAGLVHGEIKVRLRAGDDTISSMFSQRAILRQVYLKPSRRLARQREDVLVEQMLMMAIGERHYPGDSMRSLNWPFTAPGRYGPNNALSPKYLNQQALLGIPHRIPILWVRGADDRVVADTPLRDLAALIHLWLMPRWFGYAAYTPQPMLTQMRELLRRYEACGGFYREEVIPDCGHSPHLEHPNTVMELLRPFMRSTHDRSVASIASGAACARVL